jgi:hypothetical protein
LNKKGSDFNNISLTLIIHKWVSVLLMEET